MRCSGLALRVETKPFGDFACVIEANILRVVPHGLDEFVKLAQRLILPAVSYMRKWPSGQLIFAWGCEYNFAARKFARRRNRVHRAIVAPGRAFAIFLRQHEARRLHVRGGRKGGGQPRREERKASVRANWPLAGSGDAGKPLGWPRQTPRPCYATVATTPTRRLAAARQASASGSTASCSPRDRVVSE